MKRYDYTWVTAVLFLHALIGHWWLAWVAYVDEKRLHGAEPDLSGYLLETGRDTLENWRFEFLQLVWQVAGLAMFLHAGSPQSREGEDRLEEKMDAVLRAVSPSAGDRTIAELDHRFDRGEPVA